MPLEDLEIPPLPALDELSTEELCIEILNRQRILFRTHAELLEIRKLYQQVLKKNAEMELREKRFLERVRGTISRFKSLLQHLVEKSPELDFVRGRLERAAERAEDPIEELHLLFQAVLKVFDHMKNLLNPMRLPLRMTEDGRLLTQSFKNVATLITDIRGFTELTRAAEERHQLNIFDVLSFCYFPHVENVLDKHQCHYLNFTGDGLVVLSLERRNADGKVLIPALDNLVIATLDLIPVTNTIARTWQRLDLMKEDGGAHETGFGMKRAKSVNVGDPLVPERNFRDVPLFQQFDTTFREMVELAAPQFVPSESYEHSVRSVQAISTDINAASRLESLDKHYPDHTLIMTREDVERLCPMLQTLFVSLGRATLRGVTHETEIVGVPRFDKRNVPALLDATLKHYERYGIPQID